MADKINAPYMIEREAVPSPSPQFKLDCKLDTPPNDMKLQRKAREMSKTFFRIFRFSFSLKENFKFSFLFFTQPVIQDYFKEN